MQIEIINGPNLNLLGTRQPEIYGHHTFEDYILRLKNEHPLINLVYYQSNIEGELIDRLQQCEANGIILNAGAYTHTSIAIADAIATISVPVIEVHISNVWKRESFRHHSFLSPYCAGVIAGFGLESYRLALLYFLQKLSQ
ncbi:MAG: type II 3-dehydroquinate dehydratase [Bernardetiaceae bacterium]|nr:type II 3-dehydroquinate dehydratase [Bernardetiaceae bacterium]